MNKTLEEWIRETRSDPDTIQQALRLHLAERTSDMTPEEMLDEMRTAAADPQQLEEQLQRLERDSSALTQAAMEYFQQTWDEKAPNPSIDSAFTHAKEKLPVIEVTVLAIAAMYAMYLVVTGAVTEEVETQEKKLDGTYKVTKKVKREPFGPIGTAITKIFLE